MPGDSSQQFLRDWDKKLWTAADRLRSNAPVYKHAVLGLIFLVSDAFTVRKEEIEAQLRYPQSDYFHDPADYGGAESPDYADAIREELEEREYYIEKNVLWVPGLARWRTLQDSAKLPPGCEFVPLRDASAAMTNPRLKRGCSPATSDRVSRLEPVSIFR